MAHLNAESLGDAAAGDRWMPVAGHRLPSSVANWIRRIASVITKFTAVPQQTIR
jgi:hypothetical protein